MPGAYSRSSHSGLLCFINPVSVRSCSRPQFPGLCACVRFFLKDASASLPVVEVSYSLFYFLSWKMLSLFFTDHYCPNRSAMRRNSLASLKMVDTSTLRSSPKMKIACYCFDFPCLPSLLFELHDTKTLCQLRFFFSYTPHLTKEVLIFSEDPSVWS